MQDRIHLLPPAGAEGRVRIDYTSPDNNKVRERIEGKNTIFPKAFFNQEWFDMMSNISLALTDSTLEPNVKLPLVQGLPLGYGIPGLGSLGSYRGASNGALSYYVLPTAGGLASKFVYDFTPTQALGVLGTVALTDQFVGTTNPYIGRTRQCYKPLRLDIGGTMESGTDLTVGQYRYNITTAGVVTKYGLFDDSLITINLASVITSVNSKSLGYEPDTGYFYVSVYSATTSLRKVYKFSDNTFATLLATYSPTNNTRSEANFYVYGGKAFFCAAANVYVVDFVNNIAPVTKAMTGAGKILSTVNAYAWINYQNIIIGTSFELNGTKHGYTFDMVTAAQIGMGATIGNSSGTIPFYHPYDDELLVSAFQDDNTRDSLVKQASAVAIYKLPAGAPARPAGYGMTISYEVEAYY